ncbi:hypothetical protein LRO89_08000 [Priestia megaterium]|uniref:hypothetical protein n=1 Tax=Priestia megaterium TaxID=1404 RepID=UPI0039C3BCE5
MKKFLTFGTIVVSLLSFNNIVNAEESTNDIHTTYEQKEITNEEILLERAQNNISDISEKEEEKILPINDATIVNEETGEEENTETYVTTQKVQETQTDDGSQTDSYVTTVFATAAVSGDASRSDYANDASISVKASSTFYWDKSTVRGVPVYKHKGAKGSWKISDSNITISNRSYTLNNAGMNPDKGLVSESKRYELSSNSFSKAAPSTFSTIIASKAKSWVFGVTMDCKVKEVSSGDTWNFHFVNKIK